MIRKIVAGLGLLALGSYLWWGTSIGSYVGTAVTETKSYVTGQVPIEFEIKRAKKMLADIKPSIEATSRQIAQQKVKVARREVEIAQKQENLDASRVAILTLREHLTKGLTAYKIGPEEFSADDLKAELHRRFGTFKREEASLDAMKEGLDAMRKSIRAANDKYNNLVDAKGDLENEIETLEARYKMVQAKQIANEFKVDDSELNRVRELVKHLEDRVTVEEMVAEGDGAPVRHVPVEKLPPADLGQQIDDYFSKDVPAGRHNL